MPALQVSITDPIVIGDLCGFVLALPTTLFLSFWIGSGGIRHPVMGVLSAFVGALFGFLVLLGWVGTLIFPTPLPGATGAATFFGSVMLCSILGVTACIFTDLGILRGNASRASQSRHVHLRVSSLRRKLK